MLQKFPGIGRPVFQSQRHLARQNRIFPQKGEQALPLADLMKKILKAFFGRLSPQFTQDARAMHFENERFTKLSKEQFAKRREELLKGASGIKGKRRVLLTKRLNGAIKSIEAIAKQRQKRG